MSVSAVPDHEEIDASERIPQTSVSPAVYLVAGAVAGFSVDVALFPIDTIKTRMQSAEGFIKSGGFKHIYSGLGSAAIGSAPSAASFFLSYEWIKHTMPKVINSPSLDINSPVVHCTAAAIGETVACLVRVPTDNIKQKLQARMFNTTSEAFQSIMQSSGVRGFYTGYFTTIMREIPFSLIQFPLYEAMKRGWRSRNSRESSSIELALMGSLSGSFAAACTTPMDVVKTRLMLHKGSDKLTVSNVVRDVYAEGGVAKFFSGVGPRVAWIGLGGAVFLGGYEATKRALTGQTIIPLVKTDLK